MRERDRSRGRRGGRPLRQRRRATYVYRAPFQFRVSLEYLDTGAATTILFLLQPEDADSTRIYTCLFLSAGHGRPLPLPAVVAEEVAFHRLVLEEDLGLMGVLGARGCRWTFARSCTSPPIGWGWRCGGHCATSRRRGGRRRR